MSNNPFVILNNNQLNVIDYIVDDLSDDQLVIYFKQLIEKEFPNRDSKQEEIYKTAIQVIETNLKINLYKEKKESFITIFDMLYITLSLSSI